MVTKADVGRRGLGWTGWVVGLLAAAGCAEVLGIEDAELDPLVSEGDLCAGYCQSVLANCTGAFAVYSNDRTCEGVCAALPAGADEAPGNTVRCRMRQAQLAAETGEPDFHCPFAGPAGGGTCGSNCDAYCTLFAATCPAELENAFDDLQGCLEDCPAIPDLGTYNTSQTSGDSIQCRLWHLSAATVDPATDCHHAAGEAPCD